MVKVYLQAARAYLEICAELSTVTPTSDERVRRTSTVDTYMHWHAA